MIPRCSLPTKHLFELIQAVAQGASLHHAWTAASTWISSSSAYRWLAKWKRGTSQLRARLCLLHPPPDRLDPVPDLFSLRHLISAFPAVTCPIAAFHLHSQAPIFG